MAFALFYLCIPDMTGLCYSLTLENVGSGLTPLALFNLMLFVAGGAYAPRLNLPVPNAPNAFAVILLTGGLAPIALLTL